MRGNLTITSKQWQVAENFKKKKKGDFVESSQCLDE